MSLAALFKTKVCSKCNEDKPLSDFYARAYRAGGYEKRCIACMLAYSKQYNKDNSDKVNSRKKVLRKEKKEKEDYESMTPKQRIAYRLVSNAMRNKHLHPEPCVECGSEKNVHAHHNDYDKPLNVTWLCVRHHGAWHRKNGPGKNKD